MAVIIQKYGGSSLSSPQQFKSVAARVAKLAQAGHQLIVVVSAMGSTTDLLTSKAYEVASRPNRRELDMLLSTGERVSSALMSLALNDIGLKAMSFTGSQAGILTDDAHTNARVIDVKPIRIESELKAGKIAVLAGFQGVSPVTKEITTLGRGGTDLSAVCMAAYFKAKRCEILKDVDGVLSCDPKVVNNARRIPKMSFEVLRELTFWGAKMLHHRAAELAAVVGQPLWIGLAHADGEGTEISGEPMPFESEKVLSVNSHAQLIKLAVNSGSHGEGWSKVESFLSLNGISWPHILDSTQESTETHILLTGPRDVLDAIGSCEGQDIRILDKSISSVTATCAGAIGSPLIGKLAGKLESAGIKSMHLLLSPMSITFVVPSGQRELTMKVLHEFA